MVAIGPPGLSAELAAIPHIEQYAGLWSIHPPALNMLAAVASRLRGQVLAEHQALAGPRMAAAVQSAGFDRSGDTAVIHVSGTMTKYGSSLSPEGSTLLARRSIRKAVADSAVRSILLVWETPGGTVAGTEELAQDIFDAREVKRTWSYIEDLCCSAGIYAASQAERVFSNRMATIGSIGVLMAIEDWSKAYANEGVKVHLIKTGEHKGAGVVGTEVTDSHLAVWQEQVDDAFGMFRAAFRRGRGTTDAQWQEVSTGRTWIAEQALKLRLIDGIQSFDETLAAIGKRATSASAPARAAVKAGPTIFEIEAACPGIRTSEADDSLFLCRVQSAGLNVADCAAEWTKEQKARTEARREETVTKVASLVDTAIRRPVGVRSVNDAPREATGCESSDPIERWEARLAEEIEKRGSKARAVSQLVKTDPDLHQAYVAAFNARRRDR